MDLLNKKRVLFVIAHKDFRDEEYFITREALESAGVRVVTASSDLLPAQGVKGGEAKVDILLSDAVPEEYDGLVIAGGRGIRLYFDHVALQKLIQDFNEKNKIIAAICAAPVLLAKCGLLSGKKATAWHTADNMEYPDILKNAGATFVDADVVMDNRIITANAPESSNKFGEAIASLMS